jgi:hypothetical protein
MPPDPPQEARPGGDTAGGRPPAGTQKPPPGELPKLQPLDFAEQAFVDAYTEALKNGISAAADANSVLITASLAIATLYGTLIGLVAPKNQTSPIIVILPMIPLVGSFLAAVYGKTRGISFQPATTTDDVRTSLDSVVGRQRWGMRFAVGLLTIGLIAGGYILADVYGRPHPPVTVTVYLTDQGKAAVSQVCGTPATSIAGTLGSSPAGPQDVVIVPASGAPCAGHQLEFTPQEIAAIK